MIDASHPIIPRPTLTLSLMLAAVAAAGFFGHDRLRHLGKDAAAKEVASSKPPEAPSLSPPFTPAPAASQAPAAPAAPEVSSLPVPLAPAATMPQAPAAPDPPPRMTAAEEAGFDAWMMKAYLACWKPAHLRADSDHYVAWVRLAFRPDGSLSGRPKLVNPPSDPVQKPQAKSVMQAVKACDPLPVPARYRRFYEQWKTKTLHFAPQIAAR